MYYVNMSNLLEINFFITFLRFHCTPPLYRLGRGRGEREREGKRRRERARRRERGEGKGEARKRKEREEKEKRELKHFVTFRKSFM